MPRECSITLSMKASSVDWKVGASNSSGIDSIGRARPILQGSKREPQGRTTPGRARREGAPRFSDCKKCQTTSLPSSFFSCCAGRRVAVGGHRAGRRVSPFLASGHQRSWRSEPSPVLRRSQQPSALEARKTFGVSFFGTQCTHS